MKNSKFNVVAERAVMKFLDSAARKFSLKDVRHAATKWNNGMRDKAALAKQRADLEKKLAEVNKRLRV